ncbi:hypothetical protein FK268_18315 [Tsukamurella sputi]|uniref:Uncharacterized protein n=2 Tax=Tsukamurella sputi TaxID=2591848 RepID=A0A5C5RI56_9ACTN|nr:hypothetical protein FK268_18315 [Tsukamurella sputi]
MGAAATLSFTLPLVAGVLQSGAGGLTAGLVSNIRIDLVLVGLAVIALGGLGLLALGRGAAILGSVASVAFGLCDIGLMIAGASFLAAITGGDVPGFAVGLGRVMMLVLAFGAFAFLIRLANYAPDTGPEVDGAPSGEM